MALYSLSCSYIVPIRTLPKQGLDQWPSLLPPPCAGKVREGFPKWALPPEAQPTPAYRFHFRPQVLVRQEIRWKLPPVEREVFLLQEACPSAMALLGPRSLEGKQQDRKSIRLNSSHVRISYAVFCLK